MPPRVSELDFQRERLRRELQEVLNALDEASAQEDDERRLQQDAVAMLRLLTTGPIVEAYLSVVEQLALARHKRRDAG